MFRASLLLLASLALVLVSADSSDKANLIVQKKLVPVHADFPGLFAVGKNFTVSLIVHNVGNGPAYSVDVQDSWDDSFTVSHGTLSATWDEIAAGSNRTLNYSVNPTKDGEFGINRAKIEYQPIEEANAPKQVGWSSSLYRNVTIYTDEFYHKITAKHYKEWFLFSLLSLGSVVAPLAYYVYIQLHFEHGVPRSIEHFKAL